MTSRQTSNRHPEGGAADVVQAQLVAEGDGIGIAAMLTADTDFQVNAGGAPFLDGDVH